MTKKLFYIFIALLMFSSLVLGACAQTPEPTEEAVVAVEPEPEAESEAVEEVVEHACNPFLLSSPERNR